jgi:hypothetical protein
MVTGICRIRNGWVNQDSVRVRYDNGTTIEISAGYYVASRYKPPLEELPECSPKD